MTEHPYDVRRIREGRFGGRHKRPSWQARCGCGWTGRLRPLNAEAWDDARMHALERRHRARRDGPPAAGLPARTAGPTAGAPPDARNGT